MQHLRDEEPLNAHALAAGIHSVIRQRRSPGCRAWSQGHQLWSPEPGRPELVVGVSQSSPQIQRVLIVIHGRLRNAETYRQSAEKAVEQAGQGATTLVIAPQFLNETDIARHQLPDSLLRWRGNEWMAGDLSIGPNPLSSFAVLDKILERLSDRQQFPTLKEIVIAGHSGGAQVVQRYALLGHDQPALQSAGVSVRYVIATPVFVCVFR